MHFTEVLHKGEKVFDRTKFKIKKKFNLFEPIIIYPYYGYANDEQVHVQVRVIEREGILDTDKAPKSIRKKLWYMYRRYESDEVPHAEWHKLSLNISKNVFTDQKNVRAEADIMVPDKKAAFGIISDVDDTIIHSFATNT